MKKHYKHFISILSYIVISNCVIQASYAAVLEVGSTNAIYNVTYRNIATGTLTQNLQLRSDKQYQFSQQISSQIAFFDFAENEESKGTWNADTKNIQPSSYVVTGRNRLDKYQFNWSTHMAQYQKDKKKGEISIPETLYDQLSCQLLLRIALEKGETKLVCPYLNGKKIKQLHFEVIGDETMSFQNKKYDVKKVIQSNPQKPSGKKTIFWISPELSFMPLRVIQYKDNQQISVANLSEIKSGSAVK